MALRTAFMITGTGVHDRPESAFRINWIGCSRSNGIGVHDRPERAYEKTEIGMDHASQVQKCPSLAGAEGARVLGLGSVDFPPG